MAWGGALLAGKLTLSGKERGRREEGARIGKRIGSQCDLKRRGWEKSRANKRREKFAERLRGRRRGTTGQGESG